MWIHGRLQHRVSGAKKQCMAIRTVQSRFKEKFWLNSKSRFNDNFASYELFAQKMNLDLMIFQNEKSQVNEEDLTAPVDDHPWN